MAGRVQMAGSTLFVLLLLQSCGWSAGAELATMIDSRGTASHQEQEEGALASTTNGDGSKFLETFASIDAIGSLPEEEEALDMQEAQEGHMTPCPQALEGEEADDDVILASLRRLMQVRDRSGGDGGGRAREGTHAGSFSGRHTGSGGHGAMTEAPGGGGDRRRRNLKQVVRDRSGGDEGSRAREGSHSNSFGERHSGSGNACMTMTSMDGGDNGGDVNSNSGGE